MGDARFRLIGKALAALAVALAFVAWIGCSVEKNYKLLSFFFDGVPDPTLLRESADAVRLAKETGGVFYIHQPYAQQQCNQCHADSSTGEMLAEVNPRACLKCHAQVQDQHAFTHGPVAASACTWCHAPHESTIKPLLRAASPTLCRQCHGPAHMGNPRSAVHQDLTRDCLECHNAHGGAQRFFLKQTGDKEQPGPPPSGPAPGGE